MKTGAGARRRSISRSSSARRARTASTRWRPCSSGSTSATGSRSSRAATLRSPASRATRSSATRSTRSPQAAGVEPRWRATIAKRIPVAAGLGGGSSDAATALRLANETLDNPLPPDELHSLAATARCGRPLLPRRRPAARTRRRVRARSRSTCRRTTGSSLALPLGATKESTAAVYRRFDDRAGADGWKSTRRSAAERARCASGGPATSRRSRRTTSRHRRSRLSSVRLGAFRADVSGAGPAVYGLFHHRRHAGAARRALRSAARTWLTVPVWYG